MDDNQTSTDDYDENGCDENGCGESDTEIESFYDGISSAGTIHPVLERDIQLLKENCCQDSISVRSLNIINEMDLDMSFSTSSLEECVTESWGLIHDAPIILRLNLNQKHYFQADSDCKIDVFQWCSTKRSGALSQLKNIAEVFCRRSFCELTNEKVAMAVEGCTTAQASETKSKLLEMGFIEEEVDEALVYSNGSFQSALKWLFGESDSFQTLIRFFYSSKLDVKVAKGSAYRCRDPKEPPSLKKGFLVQLYRYMQQRLLTLNNYCPICDNHHVLTFDVMLKPVVCHNPLCIFSFQTLGVMADAADSIDTQPEVVNLLILLTKAAANSTRWDQILLPYPTVVHPKKLHKLALYEKKKNIEKLRAIFKCMPMMEKLVQHNEKDLRVLLDERHMLCYPLLRWIISSNRSYIVKLPPDQRLSFMTTKHQFWLRNSPPVEDRRFRLNKEKYGSVFAFHGSPIENWHSIVREGLIVASGTHRQLNGAAYGHGIYLSPQLSMSLRYCLVKTEPIKDSNKKKNSKVTSQEALPSDFLHEDVAHLACITLCEVINCPSLHRHNKEIWTCENSEFVCTRFFFVYDKLNPVNDSTVNITDKHLSKQVEKLLLHG
ncbi:unnamed protein product [Lymnaea stagnalis]|uniref:Poly [ADP-ribose] polymerase n=1 Tax=Lymnaea stagnalis TaxID=6523 RepID=A0AAV2H8P8_LYMST